MAERPAFYLPDFCRAQSVLAVILIAALVAILITLARHGIAPGFWTDLARVSLFLLWAALGTAAAWCAARGLLSGLDVRTGSALAIALALAVTALVTEGAWWIADYAARAAGAGSAARGTDHLRMQLQNLAVCAIATGLALRYFYVTHQWQANVEAEAQSRVRALQARIRPHFLFNSMNTIASLTRSNPKVRGAGDRRPLGPVPRVAARAPRAHPACARDRDRARLRAYRAAASRRTPAGRLAGRRPADGRDRAGAASCSRWSRTRSTTVSSRSTKAATIRVSGKRDGARAVLTIENPVSPQRRRPPARPPASRSRTCASASSSCSTAKPRSR